MATADHTTALVDAISVDSGWIYSGASPTLSILLEDGWTFNENAVIEPLAFAGHQVGVPLAGTLRIVSRAPMLSGNAAAADFAQWDDLFFMGSALAVVGDVTTITPLDTGSFIPAGRFIADLRGIGKMKGGKWWEFFMPLAYCTGPTFGTRNNGQGVIPFEFRPALAAGETNLRKAGFLARQYATTSPV